MLDIIWDIFQQGQISHGNHKDKLQDLKHKSSDHRHQSTREQLADLERRHEQLKLVTLSIWSLLRDHSGLLESDLRKYVEDIDLLDGKKDGKINDKKERLNCTGCDRVILSTATACPYCGEHIVQKNVFRNA